MQQTVESLSVVGQDAKEENKVEEEKHVKAPSKEPLDKNAAENSRIAQIIKERLGGKTMESAEFDESQFDNLLLEGLDLGGELSAADKAFLERFN